MVPAAVIGVDLKHFLTNAESMVQQCGPDIQVASNPGVLLGIIMGVMANHGKNKVTFIISPRISELGAWLEQLLAESTGKLDKGLIPIDKENLVSPSDYGQDRLFIYLRLKAQPDPSQDKFMDEIKNAGAPIVQIELNDIYELAKEFFRFEIATAVAGSIMEINPFNQPDVEASKVAARNITDDYEKTGKLQVEEPAFSFKEKSCSLEIFTDNDNWQAINKTNKDKTSFESVLESFLTQVRMGDYVAILAYIEMNMDNQAALQEIRKTIHKRLKVATCLGFGPRYLHSTGQVYKGGPNSGIFLEITADDTIDLAVPGKRYTFSIVKTAQAIGDFLILCKRNRRAIRINIKGNLSDGLSIIQKSLDEAYKAKI